MKSIEEALNWRYATKTFAKGRKIPDDQMDLILESGRLAPSSFGLQPYHLTVIEDAALRARLRPHSWNQSQITDASCLVVFQIKREVAAPLVDDLMARTAATRGVAIDSLAGYRGAILGFLDKLGEGRGEWAMRQLYLVMGFMLLTAAELGVDACPLEGIEPAEYDRELGETDQHAVAAVAFGYRDPGDQTATRARVRRPRTDIITRR